MTSADGAIDRPPPSALAAFGLRGSPRRLDGGQGGAFVVDDVVLKRVDDEAEAAFVQSLASRLRPTAYRLAPPMSTSDGAWVHRGWIANEHLDGLRPAAPDWAAIIAVGEAFGHDATTAFEGLDGSALAARAHRWAVADRVAWDERVVALHRSAETVDERLRSLVDPLAADGPSAVVHADLSGNVHLDRLGAPVVLDLSLYERPALWGAAVVVVDAVLWHDAPAQLVDALADDAGGLDLLARAARFRLVADALGPFGLDDVGLDRYRQLLAVLERR